MMVVSSQQMAFLTCLPKVKNGVRLFTDMNYLVSDRRRLQDAVTLSGATPYTYGSGRLVCCVSLFYNSRPLAQVIRNMTENQSIIMITVPGARGTMVRTVRDDLHNLQHSSEVWAWRK